MFSRKVVSDSFVTPWTVALEAPLSMRFPRQEYWRGLPCLPPEALLNPGIKLAVLTSSALAGMFLPLTPPEKPRMPKMGGKLY